VDVGLVQELRELGVPLVAADALAVSAAAGLSYGAHRRFSFHRDPYVRWVQQPSVFLGVAVAAGAVDLAVLRLALRRGARLRTAKLLAVAAGGGVRLLGYRWILFEGVRQRQVRRADRPPPPGSLRFSVVVPAYEEEQEIGSTIRRLREALGLVAADGGAEIIVVDDGSPDHTTSAALAAAEEEGPEGVEVVVLPRDRNRGKGAAVRAGMLAARGRAVAFTDADLAYSPDHLLTLLRAIEDGWDMVVGSRHHRETTTVSPPSRLREVGSRVINLFTMALLLGQYRDTQCGLKGFRSDVAKLLFAQTRVDGFAFDVELFHLAERYDLSLSEIPVKVQNSEGSTVKVARDAARLVRDLIRIRSWAEKGCYQATWPTPGPNLDKSRRNLAPGCDL
jgi:putative flippase GtrA